MSQLSLFTDSVKQFHEVFENPVSEVITNIPKNRHELRFNLMKEENEEYLEAAKSGNIIEIADALGDMLYILCGTIIEHGMQHHIQHVFEEIHESNMSKLDENGKPIFREDGKILKGKSYFKPNIRKMLESITINDLLQDFIKLCHLETSVPNAEEITVNDSFSSLVIDSLELYAVTVELERKYDVVASQIDIDKTRKVKEYLEYFESLIKQKRK